MINKENSVSLDTSSGDNSVTSPQGVAPVALAHTPLVNPRAYYRSKMLNVTVGINPLAIVAMPLLTLASKLSSLQIEPVTTELYQELSHEIKAFEAAAQTQGYRSEIILVARYILCAVLDEIILTTPWGKTSQWQKYTLLETFHGETSGNNRVFIILERLSADPALHIDTLELIYLCLSLGFEGKYQMMPQGKQLLDECIEHLYQTIRWQRGDIKKELAIKEELTPPSLNLNAAQPLPFWLLTAFTGIILLSLYTGFNYILSSSTAPLYEQLMHLLSSYGQY